MATSKIKNTPSIVEQGSTTTFRYRKWSDGTSECWGNIGIASTSNGLYSGSFPASLFVDTPTVSITNWYGLSSDPNRGARDCIITNGSNASNIVAYFRKADGSTYSGYFGITVHAIGRWN